MKKLFLVLILILPLFIHISYSEEFKPFDSWNKLKSEARKENKFILVHCSYIGCGWCAKMEKETYSDSAVKGYLNNHFICRKINREDSIGIPFQHKFRIRSYPTFLVFTPDGRLLLKKPGYMKPDRFMDYITTAIKDTSVNNYPGISNEINLSFPDCFLKYNKSLYGIKLDAELEKFLDSQDDPFSEVCWSIIYLTDFNEKYKRFFMDNFNRYASLYGYEEARNKLDYIINDILQAGISKNDPSVLAKIDSLVDKYFRDQPEMAKVYYRLYFADKLNSYNDLDFNLVRLFSDPDWNKSFYIGDVYNWTLKVCRNKDKITNTGKYLEFFNNLMNTEKSADCTYIYAYILYKNNQLREAREYASKALDHARAVSNDNLIDAVVKLIEKINAKGLSK